MIEITQNNFEKAVLKSHLPVIIEFGAVWCAPCKRLEPELEKLMGVWNNKVVLAHINVDDDQDLVTHFTIMSVPTVILMKDGEEKDRFTGYRPLGKIIETFEEYID
jgi:thioredoxin